MPASLSAPRWKALLWISCAALGAVSCGKRDSASGGASAPGAASASGAPAASARPAPAPPDSLAADTGAVPGSGPVSPPAPGKALAFTSHPPKAYLGKPFVYAPAVDFPGRVSLRLAKPADSAMRIENGRILWTPARPGRYPVLIEASLSEGPEAPGGRKAAGAANPEGGEASVPGKKAQQGFTLDVASALDLSLHPLPARAHKGDSVVFDLRGSRWPAWAAASLTVRFDWDGDGVWDAGPMPLPAHLAEKHAYSAPGRFAPKVEARYGDYETKQAAGSITIVGNVTASLKIAPDTVEPGGEFRVDASGSRAEGRLAYFLDVDGDGKPEWADSSSGQAVLKAPGSGVYHPKLVVRDPMGEQDKAEAVLRVNARPKIEFRVRNPKDNMAAGIDFKIRARDPDDSIRAVRFTLTGADGDWETRTAPDSQTAGREWLFRLKRVYGKAGTFAPKACVAAADGREDCQALQVDIFNAPPECRPGGDLRATVGQPVAIDGTGVDPDGKIVKWEWDLDGDGKYDLISTENGKFQYTFGKEGIFTLTLRVTTADGMTATGKRKVEVRKRWKT